MKNFNNYPKLLKLVLFVGILLLNTINGITQNKIRVIAARGKTAIINAGSSSGIMKGEKYYLDRVTKNGKINAGIVKVVIVKQRKAAIKFIESNESNNIKKNDILGNLYEDIFDDFFNEDYSHNTTLPKTGSVGLGFGLQYGILGCNLEYFIMPIFSLTGGVGHTLISGVGYNAGVKLYFKENRASFRPRISAYYGLNAIIYIFNPYGEDIVEDYQGISVGIGGKLGFGKSKRHGIDFDVMYLVTRGDFDKNIEMLRECGMNLDESGSSKVKLSFGYRFCF